MDTANRKPHTAYRILLSAFCFLLSLNCSAQTKFGHVDYSSIISKMQGIDSIQSLITNFQAELQAIGEEMSKEFKEKNAALEKLANNPSTSQAVLKIKQDELVAMYKRIQEFADSMDADVRDKQLELLEPFQKRLLDAIKKIAKTNNYSYILDISTLVFFSATDDLTDKVKAELGIK
jgi:outer membrane protein